MAVKEVTMYQIICDTCGEADSDSEFYAWSDSFQAVEIAEASEWLITDNGHHFCPNCQEYDEPSDSYVGKAPHPSEESS